MMYLTRFSQILAIGSENSTDNVFMSYMSLVTIKKRSKSPNSNDFVKIFSNNASQQVLLKSRNWLRK